MPTRVQRKFCSDLQVLKDAKVVAAFDGGAISSDAGALTSGRQIAQSRLTERVCRAVRRDTREEHLIEHEVDDHAGAGGCSG